MIQQLVELNNHALALSILFPMHMLNEFVWRGYGRVCLRDSRLVKGGKVSYAVFSCAFVLLRRDGRTHASAPNGSCRQLACNARWRERKRRSGAGKGEIYQRVASTFGSIEGIASHCTYVSSLRCTARYETRKLCLGNDEITKRNCDEVLLFTELYISRNETPLSGWTSAKYRSHSCTHRHYIVIMYKIITFSAQSNFPQMHFPW